MNESKTTPLQSTLHLHVCNSGVTFSISDEFGPTVSIKTSAFGNLQQDTKFFTTKDCLRRIGELFIEASKREFDTEYCHAAKLSGSENGSPELNSAVCGQGN